LPNDRFDLPLSTTSDAAAEAYRLAADRLLAGVDSPLEVADIAIEQDSGFALAHCARATGLLLDGDPVAAREAAERGVELAASASRRERQHAAITLDVVTGRRDAALAKVREHLVDFPLDALAIDPAAGVFGLIGFSGRQDREAEQLSLLEPLADHYGDDWWFQRTIGFALLENDRVEESLPLVASALAARPDSGHVAHTWVHALFEAGDHQRATNWLVDWLPGYSRQGILFCHLWWHLALFHLLNRDFDAMWTAYDDHCLAGQSASPAINLFVHRAACLAALGDQAALTEFRGDCRKALDRGRLAAGEVVFGITDGFEAFANGDWARARAALEVASPSVVRIGGSRAQRRIVSETLAAATARMDSS
jgi:hypothetical protein